MTSHPQAWRKSSYSAQGGDCVEVAPLPLHTGVRDSKSRANGHLALPSTPWDTFIRTLKSR